MQDREQMIKYCYRLLLGRWPSEEEWANCPYENIDDLRDSMLQSEEFYAKHQNIFKQIMASLIIKELTD